MTVFFQTSQYFFHLTRSVENNSLIIGIGRKILVRYTLQRMGMFWLPANIFYRVEREAVAFVTPFLHHSAL